MSKENDPLGIFPDYDPRHSSPQTNFDPAFDNLDDARPMTKAEEFGEKATALLMYSMLGLVMIFLAGGAWNLIKWLF